MIIIYLFTNNYNYYKSNVFRCLLEARQSMVLPFRKQTELEVREVSGDPMAALIPAVPPLISVQLVLSEFIKNKISAH